jgi:hypothetical protein
VPNSSVVNVLFILGFGPIVRDAASSRKLTRRGCSKTVCVRGTYGALPGGASTSPLEA